MEEGTKQDARRGASMPKAGHMGTKVPPVAQIQKGVRIKHRAMAERDELLAQVQMLQGV